MKQKTLTYLCLTLALCFLCSVRAYAETVTGLVLDDTGEPLIGATVIPKGDAIHGTVTDIDGRFSVNVPDLKKGTLQVSYVGMKTAEVRINGRSELNITLQSDATELTSLVVVGYGQQKKASVVGAITQTTGEVLQRAGGVSSIGNALTGNLPGVVTNASTGMPGDEDPKIVIRGISTWNNSDPLILVDGIERPMSSVDVNSVKSISVLKDASATAVYGVKGANGVILITTKRGTEGRAQISASMNFTTKVISQLPRSLESADALMVRNRAIERELGISPNAWAKITPMEIIEKYRNPASLEEAERYPNVDWQDALFKKSAMSYNPNISLSGGTKFVKYYAAFDYLHEGDLYRTYDNNRGYKTSYAFDRINVRSNLDFQITKSTLLKMNLSGSHGVRNMPWDRPGNDWYSTQLWQSAYSAPHDAFIPRYSDGTWGYYPANEQGAPNSIVGFATLGHEKRTTTRINTDFSLVQDMGFLLPGLKISAMVSWDNTFVERDRGIRDGAEVNSKWIDPDTGLASWDKYTQAPSNFDWQEGLTWVTEGGKIGDTERNLYYQGQISWANTFGDHSVSAMGVFNRNEKTINSEFTNYREDWAFRATYDYANRYFVEYNGAYNGSERFGVKHRFEFFNSGAIGWMLSNEKFMSFARNWLDNFKIRYSIGQVGDDNINERWMYATQWAYDGKSNLGIYPGNNSPYTWYKETKVGNPDIHWEKALKQNLGIDFGFLNGIIGGTFEFFQEKRSDILVAGDNRAVPSYFGATVPTANLGKVRTRGYELELRLNYTFANSMRLWGNFNMTHAENKILSFDDPDLAPDYQKKAGFAIDQDQAYYTNGFAQTWDQVIGMTPHNTGDNQKLPGQYITVDYNGDGVIDNNDLTPYGYTGTPQNTFNATIGWEWKGFSAFVQFYGVTNVTRYVGFTSLDGHLDTVFKEGSYWSQWNQNADAPMPRWDTTPSYYEGTRYHYDGSYLRLKNAEIAYTWTGGWIKKLGLNQLKIYLNGNNLLVWHHMPDDRENNFAGNKLATQGAYPTVRRFNLGIKFDL